VLDEVFAGLDSVFDPGDQKPGRHGGPRVVRPQLIPGQLQPDELVEGHVLVERADDEVPVTPCLGAVVVHFESVAFGKPRDIQPVASPSLAESGVTQQSIDGPVPCLRLACRTEAQDMSWGWWQADHVERRAAEQDGRSRGGSRVEVGPSVFGGDKCVDRISDPGCSDPWYRWPGQRSP